MFTYSVALVLLATGAAISISVRAQTAMELVSNSRNYQLTIVPSPDEIPLNGTFAFDVNIRNLTAPTDCNLTMAFNAAMPSHNHGMVQKPIVTKTDACEFSVKGVRLHMPGTWVLYFDIARGGVIERAEHNLNLDPSR